MNLPLNLKSTLHRLIMAAFLPVMAQAASATVLLTDNFLVSSNSSNLNQQLAGRQAGLLAPVKYSGWATVYQIGNTTTVVGQPGGATNGNFVLLANNGSFFNNLPIGSVASGPLTVQFNMYMQGSNNPSTDPTSWGACALRQAGSSFPVAGTGEFGFLQRANGGVQVFNNGGNIAPSNWDPSGGGFATNSSWTLIFSDTSGTGSAFNGNGSQVTLINGTNTLGTLALGQLNSAGLRLGFCDNGNRYVGIANLAISGTSAGLPPPGQNLSFEYDTTLPGTSINIIPTGWTGFNVTAPDHMGSQYPSGTDYTAPLTAPADGNQFYWVNAFNGDGVVGIYQDMGALLPNTVYTLTVAIGSRGDRINSPGIISLVNGADNTGTVLASGGGLPSAQNTWQDYTVTFATGGSVSGDLTIVLSALGAGTIQANFDNVRLTSVVSAVPLPILVSNPAPASATVGTGSNVVFTAAFSNSPPVSLQWLQIVGNVTNAISTGVVNATNNGVVTSTLTLNNVQPSNAGSYQLKAANATNLVTVVYSQSASINVVPLITWYSAGAYNYTFSDNSVLALAGSVADEVYGVDFGGSGAITTDNGYSFDDYSSGNMSIAGSGLSNFSGYEGSASTGDFNFDNILNNGVYGSSANTATLNNLTVGQTYTVLVLMDDTRTSGASGPNFNITDGLSSSPAQRYAFPNGSPVIGGYIMGTFTAAATSQPLTVLNNGNAQYIAVLLEKGIAAPPQNAPELTADLLPPVLEVTTGGSVTLTIGAGGTLPLQYQWYNQSGPINGAIGTNYSFNAVAGTNYYQVVVTNSFGSVTSLVAEVISSTNIVTINNFSFEAGTQTGSGGFSIPLAWSDFNNHNFSTVAADSYSVVNPLAPTADGNDFFAINEGPSDPTGGIYQDVGPLLPNTTYTLTVATGRRQDFPNPPGTLGSPGIISLVNGTNNTGTVLASTNGIPAATDSWQDNTVTFITGPSVSGDLTVELSVAGASTYQANFDNVRLTKVPAPAVVPPTLMTDINPLRSEVTTGAPWTLSVAANGNPLYYQWFNQGGPISGATNASYSFNAVAGTNSYYVSITNSASAIVSSTAVVISATNIVTVNNFSFENGSTPAFGNGAIPSAWTDYNSDWCTVSGDTSALNPPVIPDGNLYYARNSGPGDAAAGGVYQDVGALLANTTYTLTVSIGRRDDTGPGGAGNWSPGIISLLNGTDNNGALLASTTGYPDTAGTWQDYTTTFSTGASVSGHLTVELSVAPANTYQALFDYVRLTKASSATPTPPIFSSPKFSGGNLILTGTGGTPFASYTWLSTTNLSAPVNWTTNSTGTLDGSGSFSNAIPVNVSQPASFFRLRLP